MGSHFPYPGREPTPSGGRAASEAFGGTGHRRSQLLTQQKGDQVGFDAYAKRRAHSEHERRGRGEDDDALSEIQEIGASADLLTVTDELVAQVRMADGLNPYRFRNDSEVLAAWDRTSRIGLGIS